jgi:serine/threonine-protein kinase
MSPLEEGRHLARVRQSNIVTVYGADREGDEVGIWMEYVDGHTLAEMIHDRGPMSAREVAGVGIDLCRALAALHGAGLLHRDIKAQNVMRELGGRIVLMDFSGAHAITRNNPAVATSGTPLYMAPEVLNSGAATVASDVYSLGVLLFFLLTGRLPVEGSGCAICGPTCPTRSCRSSSAPLRWIPPNGIRPPASSNTRSPPRPAPSPHTRPPR